MKYQAALQTRCQIPRQACGSAAWADQSRVTLYFYSPIEVNESAIENYRVADIKTNSDVRILQKPRLPNSGFIVHHATVFDRAGAINDTAPGNV
jgi:hypothetical protein